MAVKYFQKIRVLYGLTFDHIVDKSCHDCETQGKRFSILIVNEKLSGQKEKCSKVDPKMR